MHLFHRKEHGNSSYLLKLFTVEPALQLKSWISIPSCCIYFALFMSYSNFFQILLSHFLGFWCILNLWLFPELDYVLWAIKYISQKLKLKLNIGNWNTLLWLALPSLWARHLCIPFIFNFILTFQFFLTSDFSTLSLSQRKWLILEKVTWPSGRCS